MRVSLFKVGRQSDMNSLETCIATDTPFTSSWDVHKRAPDSLHASEAAVQEREDKHEFPKNAQAV